ncbi:hypothetical protein HNY73_018022 [Argiope bruennichi]|uniref:SOCS box domain-containing protein n=1 Tax=Argiope bruennichi TaxID=94029 RepID=A0A8T0ECF3_ARGBR|nr:hypothetical protein HNY73_018022 [Argiope bruennichi]
MLRIQNWDGNFFENKIYFEPIRLRDMQMIAKYSFIVHKSINHLDLSLREFSSMREKRKVLVPLLFCAADPAFSKKFVCTAEACRKMMVLERRWLYSLHLDLPHGRENDFISLNENEVINCWQPKTICFNELFVNSSIYQWSLRRFMGEALDRSGMQVDSVRRQMALMKRVLDVTKFERHSLEERILNFLYLNCTDPDMVKEFLLILDFNSWVLRDPKQNMLDYLLYYAYRSRFNLKLNDKEGILVNKCFFKSQYRNVELLLKYQNAPFYYDHDYSCVLSNWQRRDIPNDWYPEYIDAPLLKGLMSKRRYLLWLQVFHSYAVRNQYSYCGRTVSNTLLLLWRSLPDSYFTLEELLRAYEDVPKNHKIIQEVYKFYEEAMDKDLISDKPRLLQQYCRTSIRRLLSYNLQLPYGIAQLGLPPKLKVFLTLEK